MSSLRAVLTIRFWMKMLWELQKIWHVVCTDPRLHMLKFAIGGVHQIWMRMHPSEEMP